MSINLKKLLVGFFAILMGLCFALSLNVFSAKADAQGQTYADGNFYMAGVSIRYEQNDDGEDGIRYGAFVKKSWYDQIVADNAGAEIVVGMAVAPKAELTAVNFDAMLEVVEDGNAIARSTMDSFGQYNDDYYLTKLYIHSIPRANYNTELVAYAIITVDGEAAYYTAEPIVHSLASAAKYLLDNDMDIEHETELDAYLINYDVNYLNGDGSILYTNQVKYGETSSFDGSVVPTKEATAQTGYIFSDYSETQVKGSVDVQPNFAKYLPMDNYIYCANKVFTLPTQVGTEIEAFGLSYEFNGQSITAGQEITIATPGKYDYSITVGTLGTIETEIEVLSEEEYKKNYFRTDSTQFFTGVGSTNGRIIVNGNNELSIMDDGSYKYTAKKGTTWDDRISLSSDFVGGTANEWNLDEFNTISMQLKLGDDFTPSSLGFNIETNAHANSNKIYPFVVYDANWSVVPVANMQKGVWYTIVGDLQNASNVETNAFRFYLFNNQTGSLFFKNIMFNAVDHVSMIMGGTERGIISVVQLDEATYGRNTGAYKIEQTGGTWGGHIGVKFYNDLTEGTYYAYDLYVESSSFATSGVGCGLQTGYAGQYTIYDSQGNAVTKAQVELGKWYTVLMPYRASEYYYHANGGGSGSEVSYVANPRIIKGFGVWQTVDVAPSTVISYDNGSIVSIDQLYNPGSAGWGARIGFTESAIDSYLSYQAKNTENLMYQMKMDVVFGTGDDSDFQFWYRNSAGSMLAVTFTAALSNGWMDMVDESGNTVTTWEAGVKYTFIVNTTMDLGSNSADTEHGLQIAMKTTARSITFSNLRFEAVSVA